MEQDLIGKGVRDNATDKCQKCLEKNRPCFEVPSLRFRPFTSVNLKDNDQRRVKQDAMFTPSQRWVIVPEGRAQECQMKRVCGEVSTVEFVPNNKDAVSSKVAARARQARSHAGDDDFGFDTITDDPARDESDARPLPAQYLTSETSREQITIMAYIDTTVNGSRSSPEPFIRSATPKSLYDVHKQRRLALVASTAYFGTQSPVPREVSWPFATQHQARLFKHYIRELAPWVRASVALSGVKSVCKANNILGRFLRQSHPFRDRNPPSSSFLSHSCGFHLRAFFSSPQPSYLYE